MTRPLTLLAAVAVLGLFRIGWSHTVREGGLATLTQPAPRIDARFQPLRPLLLPRARLGYVSDQPLDTLEGQRLYAQATYALAPALLLPDDGRLEQVVASCTSVEAVEHLRQTLGLTLLKAGPDGAALLGRKAASR